MKNNSTLICIVDNMDEPSVKLVNVNQLMDDIDKSLDDLFRDADIKVPSSLVEKTLEKIKKS